MYPLIGALRRKCRIKMKDRKVDVVKDSVNAVLTVPPCTPGQLPICPLLAFEEITKGDFKIYVRDTTAFQPHPLPLVASQVKFEDQVRPFSGPLVTPHMSFPRQNVNPVCVLEVG